MPSNVFPPESLWQTNGVRLWVISFTHLGYVSICFNIRHIWGLVCQTDWRVHISAVLSGSDSHSESDTAILPLPPLSSNRRSSPTPPLPLWPSLVSLGRGSCYTSQNWWVPNLYFAICLLRPTKMISAPWAGLTSMYLYPKVCCFMTKKSIRITVNNKLFSGVCQLSAICFALVNIYQT